MSCNHNTNLIDNISIIVYSISNLKPHNVMWALKAIKAITRMLSHESVFWFLSEDISRQM